MEGLLSAYLSSSDDEQGDNNNEQQQAQAQDRDSDDDSSSSSSSSSSLSAGANGQGARSGRRRKGKRRRGAGAAAGLSSLSSPPPPLSPRLTGSKKRPRGVELPSLDADFFSVSPNHVYTTVLTNGQRLTHTSSSLPLSSSSDGGGQQQQQPQRWARAVPHIEGNWATHVYIRVPNTDDVLELARACIAHGQARLGGGARLLLLPSESEAEEGEDDAAAREEEEAAGKGKDDGGGSPSSSSSSSSSSLVIVPGDLRPAEKGGAQHLSLSRTVYLRAHHIDPFVEDLRRALAWATSFAVELEPRFRLLVNDERTRSFLTVGAAPGCGERLRRLVGSVDAVLGRYRQPLYYPDPAFHVSVASLRGDAAGAWEAAGAKARAREQEEEEDEEAEAVVVDVDTVEVRIGKKLFAVPLR